MTPTVQCPYSKKQLRKLRNLSLRLFSDTTLEETPSVEDLQQAKAFCALHIPGNRHGKAVRALYLQFLWILPSATGLFEEHLRRQLKDTAS